VDAVRDPMKREAAAAELEALEEDVVGCRKCPRLVAWREKMAREKRAAFEDQEYWGRPVPGFGDPGAWLLIVGLAPAAHGANRTGRMFTGDRSGDWLFRALHRAGFASQPEGRSRDDGLRLIGCWLTASVRCAPPDNRPEPSERKRCRPYLEREVDALLPGLKGIVALGGYAYRHVMRIFRDRGWDVPSPMPDFGHGLELELGPPPDAGGADGTDGGATGRRRGGAPLTLLTSYHPSQQNTFTGTLTEEMFDRVWERARRLGVQGGL
jgi:uracil-DNA glycosylase family 4